MDTINKRVAGRYVKALAELHPVTRAKHITSLRSYWAYLHRRGLIKNGDKHRASWTDREMPDRSNRVDRNRQYPERPFTAEEVTTLLTSLWPHRLDPAHRGQAMEALLISLLSVLRLEEVMSL